MAGILYSSSLIKTLLRIMPEQVMLIDWRGLSNGHIGNYFNDACSADELQAIRVG